MLTENNFKRTFIAVKVNPDNNLLNLLSNIKSRFSDEKIVWNRLENYHITILFIGNTNESQIQLVEKSLEKIRKKLNPFHFNIEGMGVFPAIHNARVMWLGTSHTSDLNILKNLCDEYLIPELGMGQQVHFKQHLTIGRMRKINDQDKLREVLANYKSFGFLKVEVEEIIFYESIITANGPIYEVLSTYRLGNSG